MSLDIHSFEQRLSALESSLRRWRAFSLALVAVSLITFAAGFQQTPNTQSLETDRITLRSLRPPRTQLVDISVATDGALQVHFRDSTHFGVPELRLIDGSGRRVARLGPPGSWLSDK